MKITIVGGGNIGTQFAVHCAEKSHEVTIFTSKLNEFQSQLSIIDDAGTVTHEGTIAKATNNPDSAFVDADMIIVTMPATCMKDIAEVIYQKIDAKSIIGIVPGNGGGECAFKKCIERGNQFFGLERVPAVARLIQKGKMVKSIGYRNELHISAISIAGAVRCSEIIGEIFNAPVR